MYSSMLLHILLICHQDNLTGYNTVDEVFRIYKKTCDLKAGVKMFLELALIAFVFKQKC